MQSESLFSTPFVDIAYLVARVIIGLLMAAHGSQKLFGWFGGHGLQGTGAFIASLGFRPASLVATVAALSEFLSGLLVAAGFLGPIGPAVMLAVMIVAAMSVHWQNGLFATDNGIELALLYAVAALRFALTGPGRFSLDAAFDLEWTWTPTAIWIALLIGFLGGVTNLALRRRPTAPSA